jgi:hypothetical protein
MTSFRRFLVTGVTCCAASWINAPGTPPAMGGQNPDQDAARTMADGSREVVRTAPTAADRIDTTHVIVYVDKGLLTTEAEREFAQSVDRMFAATSTYLQRRFDPTRRKTALPAYYLTNWAGISHAESTRIFLGARRVIPSPAIVIHESVHLLLMKNPDAPRNRDDLTPEVDARVMANSGVWLAEGFAGYVAYELAPRLNLEPDHLFVKGDRSTVDAEAGQWIRDPRGAKVLPYVGAAGMPEGLLADRTNVAAPFYVLGQSFIKYLVLHAGLATVTRLYEEHFDGTRAIADDVNRITGRALADWRAGWLEAFGGSR